MNHSRHVRVTVLQLVNQAPHVRVIVQRPVNQAPHVRVIVLQSANHAAHVRLTVLQSKKKLDRNVNMLKQNNVTRMFILMGGSQCNSYSS